jgi:hypothetical protein
MSLPSLSVAPGPTAMTVASGSGELVADVGRKRPVAVFCTCDAFYEQEGTKESKQAR